MSERIQFVVQTLKEVKTKLDRGRTWRPWRPWRSFKWLEKLALRLFVYFSDDDHDTFIHHKVVTVSEDKVTDAIVKALHEFHRVGSKEIRHVIMGPEQAFEAKQEAFVANPWSFYLPIEIRDGEGCTIKGLEIHVVPWFDGILLLPSWDDLQSRQYRLR